MDTTQERHERAIGDAFTKWYNEQNRTHFRYHDRGDRGAERPDLIYRSGSDEMLLEVTTGYYDQSYAKFVWQNTRRLANAPDEWSGKEPDQSLIRNINSRLQEKCVKGTYPPSCVLVLTVYPDVTLAEEFADLVPEIRAPRDHAFAGIYVGGLFPACSSGSPGGYQWWKLPTCATGKIGNRINRQHG